MHKKVISLVGAGLLGASVLGVPMLGLVGTASADTGKDKITICHRTGSASNPYVVIHVPAKSEDNAHNDNHHQQVGNGQGADIKTPNPNLKNAHGPAPAVNPNDPADCLDP